MNEKTNGLWTLENGSQPKTVEQLVIIGSGPAGHTAGIYTARAELKPLLFEGFMAGGVAAGGQLTTTTEVENFPGFPTGISGPQLMERMREQCLHLGVRIESETVEQVDLSQRPFRVQTEERTVYAQALIIATGATARRLGIPGEDRLWQRGISACAVCDGSLPMFRNQTLIVVGGGDTAVEEAMYLSKFAEQVLLVHRRGELRASQAMRRRLDANRRVQVKYHHVVAEAHGQDALESVTLRHAQFNDQTEINCRGLFYAVGHLPNTSFLQGQVDLDETGYVVTKPGTTQTSRPGVFAAGDVQDKRFRQAITAAGSGCMAALEAEAFLAGH